jgi:MFS family permease
MTNIVEQKDKLCTPNFIFMCIANFLMSFSFYILIPTLPFYLIDTFNTGQSAVGVILSIYTVSILLVRPFSGFLADTFQRKPLYLFAYFIFASFFLGYAVAGSLLVFTIIRIIHGLAFGMLSTTGNTLVIDVMPSSRRGEGLGYFGVTGNIAMALGPMIGLILKDLFPFEYIFYLATISGVIGILFVLCIKTPKRELLKSQPISLDRFFLVKGIPASIPFLFLAIPYAMTSSYIALYVSSIGLTSNSGLFFSVMAVGMILSRILSGKLVDKGFITQNVTKGIIIALVAMVGEVLLETIMGKSFYLGCILYYLVAFLFGYGFGTLFPAMNTLFINLAPHNRRATANSMYLTGWDVGIGIGAFLGGYISEHAGFISAYATGLGCAILALIVFVVYATPHFNKNRLC